MLLVYFKPRKNVIIRASAAFNHRYSEEWLVTDIGKRIVREIDKSEVLDKGAAIRSDVLGVISPERLSGGTKALFLARFKDDFISSICFGDNCSELLLQISEEKDVKLVINHMLSMNDTIGKTRKVYFPELGVYAKDNSDYIEKAIIHMGRMKYL